MALHFGSSTLTRGDRLGHFLKGAESIPLPWPYTLEPIKTITSWLIWISKKVWKGMHVWTFKKWSSKSSPWFTNTSSVLYHKNTTVVCCYYMIYIPHDLTYCVMRKGMQNINYVLGLQGHHMGLCFWILLVYFGGGEKENQF